jgi:hypothetical protein
MTTSWVTPYVTVRPATWGLAKALLLAIAYLPRMSAAPVSLHYLLNQSGEVKPPSDPSLWLHLGVAAALVLMGGAFAGLTIALMGQVRANRPEMWSVTTVHRSTSLTVSSRMKSICRLSKHPARNRRKRTRPVFSACYGEGSIECW